MAKRTTTMKNFCGLEWVTVTGIPCRHSKKYGELIHAQDLKRAEEMVAAYIVKERVPIRGAEVSFLRRSFGYSLGAFGADLGFTPTAILKWERAREKRLDRVNEIAVRAWAAERLKLEISGRLSKLIAIADEQGPVTLKAA